MSKYTKPTISVLNANAVSGSTSSCSGSSTDAQAVLKMLEDMGYDLNTCFGAYDGSACPTPITFVDYCKFTSGVQIFYS